VQVQTPNREHEWVNEGTRFSAAARFACKCRQMPHYVSFRLLVVGHAATGVGISLVIVMLAAARQSVSVDGEWQGDRRLYSFQAVTKKTSPVVVESTESSPATLSTSARRSCICSCRMQGVVYRKVKENVQGMEDRNAAVSRSRKSHKCLGMGVPR